MDVQLPSQQPASTEAKIKHVEHASRNSMQMIFGGSIIILAIVTMGIVFYLGNVPVPYLSAFFAPAPSPFIPRLNQSETLRPGLIATTSATTTTATTTLKK
jgi:hypothetical protein